jgi:GGDEF domain-containing protein
MNTKTTKVLFLFIVCLYVVALLVFVCGVWTQYRSGQKKAGSDFRVIINSTGSVFQNSADDVSSIKTGMDRVFNAYENLAAMTVQIAGVPVFAQQSNIGFISLSAYDEPVITASSPVLRTFSGTFTVQDGRIALASAAIYVLKPQSVYNTARFAFLIILAATALAVIFVFASHNSRRAVVNGEPDAAVPEISESAEYEAEPADQDTQKPAVAGFSAPMPEPETVSVPRTPDVPAAIVRTAPPDGMSFLSPVTGFTWETFLETRLEAELQRATETEQDLALFIILLPNLEHNSESAVEIFRHIANQFRYTDYIFEYKHDGVAAIVQNSTMEDSLNQAERLFVKLNTVTTSDASIPQFGIGISNRTYRIISARRLIGEAEEAAQRAINNPETPVVALKIDPIKYREYLSGTNTPGDSKGADNYST